MRGSQKCVTHQMLGEATSRKGKKKIGFGHLSYLSLFVMYEVSSKTNAKVQTKTEQFKIET